MLVACELEKVLELRAAGWPGHDPDTSTCLRSTATFRLLRCCPVRMDERGPPSIIHVVAGCVTLAGEHVCLSRLLMSHLPACVHLEAASSLCNNAHELDPMGEGNQHEGNTSALSKISCCCT